MSATVGRPGLHFAVRIEWFTVAWMTIEAIISIAAGLFARSLLLTAFGLDRVIELITGTILLWRLRVGGQLSVPLRSGPLPRPPSNRASAALSRC